MVFYLVISVDIDSATESSRNKSRHPSRSFPRECLRNSHRDLSRNLLKEFPQRILKKFFQRISVLRISYGNPFEIRSVISLGISLEISMVTL